MLVINYGANITISGRSQFSVSNQVLRSEVYKHFSITLDATLSKKEIILSEVKKHNLLPVKATSALAKNSSLILSYKIGDAGNFIELDALLSILGAWVNSIVQDDQKISFKLDPKPSNDSNDAVGQDYKRMVGSHLSWIGDVLSC